MTMVRTQTIQTLRLFWHRRHVSFKVFKKAITTAEIAENPFIYRRLSPDPAERTYRFPNPIAGGQGLAATAQKLRPTFGPSASIFGPLVLIGPLSKMSRSAVTGCNRYTTKPTLIRLTNYTDFIQGGPKKRGHSTFSQISRKLLIT